MVHRRMGIFQMEGVVRNIRLMEGPQLLLDHHLLSFVCSIDPRWTWLRFKSLSNMNIMRTMCCFVLCSVLLYRSTCSKVAPGNYFVV